jgi:hypothetical protein
MHIVLKDCVCNIVNTKVFALEQFVIGIEHFLT